MELPDCPPGAEGYQDSVAIELPKKPSVDDSSTKAEAEFKEHLNSLKIKVEDESVRCMVERRGRDVSGKWIYLCYPCAAMCSGESILQTHISGKKHKARLSMKTVWPVSIYDDHPYFNEKAKVKGDATEEVLQKMAEEVEFHNKTNTDPGGKYKKYKNIACHIQGVIDGIKAPLIGLEYLVEHPPEESHHEPSYICTLCSKQGHPRTIVNHLTCFWHRYNYLIRHFNKACTLLTPFRNQPKYREGVSLIINRLAQRIEDKYGRLRPKHIDKEEFEKDKDNIHKWIFNDFHFAENADVTLEEVVDVDLISNLSEYNEPNRASASMKKRDPSPPIVNAPTRPHIRQRRRSSLSLSDVSDEEPRRKELRDQKYPNQRIDKPDRYRRVSPFHDKRRTSPQRSRYSIRNAGPHDMERQSDKTVRDPKYEYKVKLASERRAVAEEAMKKMLSYHEKNPEKHPLYPEEWKKFWNRRYKEIQAEGKEPSKHDFKPEWIVFWTARMKKLHEEELRSEIIEIYRKLCLPPPDERPNSPEPRRRSPERKRPLERKRSVERRRSPPDYRKRQDRRPELDVRKRSLEPSRRPHPEARRSPPDYRRNRRTPDLRRSSPPPRRGDPLPRPRSRSPFHKRSSPRLVLPLESLRGSRSPLSRRNPTRNRSPAPATATAPEPLDTVLVSDDELQAENISPWNSDNDLNSLGSLPDARCPPLRSRSRTGSVASRPSRSSRAPMSRDYRRAEPSIADLGPAENVVATLRLLVALEDYLGSLGPKVIDLLAEALKLEKEKANSSEELLERESAVVLLETSKEKLKGAVQAGLVPGAAAAAVRAAVVRLAATLHAADTRRASQKSSNKAAEAMVAMPVAGVGEVNRAEIASQMAAALIAQGKTDVSADELAQLVDAVVGMAEAKKRETEAKKKAELKATVAKAAKATANSASALQMLQSAYDEYDKKAEKEEAPDAMDGLSDSDLETLLKNFSELSAEEQHSLIAYLKKLEAKDPQRVEKLRQYVTAAGTSSPPKPAPPVVEEKEETPPKVVAVTIESDDDDYTVDEVFKSATQKVNEDQIRQEMEIVKKSLEETTKTPPVTVVPVPEPTPIPEAEPETAPTAVIDLSDNLSSASDLLALVQASIQASSGSVPAPRAVAAAPAPRSFADPPQPEPTWPSAEQNSNDDAMWSQSAPYHEPENYDHSQAPFPEQNSPSSFTENRNFAGNSDNSYKGGNFVANRGRGQFGNRGNFGNHGNFNSNTDEGNFARNQSQGNFGNNRGQFNNKPNQGNFGLNSSQVQGSFGNNSLQSKVENHQNEDDYGNLNIGNFAGNSRQGNFGGNSHQSNLGGNSSQGGLRGNSSQGGFRGNSSQGSFRGNSSRGNFGGNSNQGNFGGNSNPGNFGGISKQDNFGGISKQDNFGGNSNPGNFGGISKQNNFGDNSNAGSFGSNSNQSNFGSNSNQSNFGNNSNQGNPDQSQRGNFNNNSNRGFGGRPNQGQFGGNKSNQGNFGNNQMHNNFGPNQGNFGRGRGGRGQRGRGRGYY